VSRKDTPETVYWKATTVVKRPPAYLADLFYSKSSEIVANKAIPLTELVVLKEFDDFRIVYGKIKGKAVFTSRDNCLLQSIHIDGQNRWLYQKSISGVMPERKVKSDFKNLINFQGHIRVTNFFTCAYCVPHPLDPQKSIVNAVAHNDFGGLIPKKVIHVSNHSHIKVVQYRRGLSSHHFLLEKSRKDHTSRK
jgi:hypothetical protein